MDNFLNSFRESLSESFFGGRNNAFQFQAPNAPFVPPTMNPPQSGGNKGAPPISLKALRQLPIVAVTPEDLVDENNRECCICLEENHLKDHVMRLPCAHIFHQRCIVDWLTKHSTCPVCRYEFPTDDREYEKSRKARMKHRKPRIHMYVLERMPIHELKDMAKELNISWPRRIKVKADILEAFVKSGRIEIIAAPEPVEYSLLELRSMGVGKLRRAMEEAGVFFDPIDVVEKEDMVQIFCNSGRLVLRPDQPSEHLDKEDMKISADDVHDAPLEDNCSQGDQKGIVVETVDDDDDDDDDDEHISREFEGATAMFDVMENDLNLQREPADENLCEASHAHSMEGVYRYETEASPSITTPCNPLHEEQELFVEGQVPIARVEHTDVEDEKMESEPSLCIDAAIAAAYAQYETCSILDLRSAARDLNVDISRCIERSEMVEKLVQANNGQKFSREDFEQWSVSDMRSLAAAVGVNLSQCTDRSDMIKELLRESEDRPYVANYIASLMPLAALNVSELRGVARRHRVNVSDCLEKEEMVHRLVAATLPVASSGMRA